jgi:SAM-dependent methyltransferase
MVGHAEVNVYDESFYEQHTIGALRSARVILPLVLAHLPVRSAVDIGCGRGAWLRVLEELEVTDIAGYDGEYVDRSRLLTDSAKFTAADLRDGFEIGRTFDLAISLEVAEHLPSEFAQPLVQCLVTAAPFVLFSAAIPGQGGVHHVNEQWQDYWRSIFQAFCFSPVDLVRPVVWGHADVEFWYQQNIILYCSNGALRNSHHLKPVPHNVSLNKVHPTLYETRVDHFERQLDLLKAHPQLSLKAALKLLPSLAWSAAARRTKKFHRPIG